MKVHDVSPKEKVYNLVIGSWPIKDSEWDNLDVLSFLKLSKYNYMYGLFF